MLSKFISLSETHFQNIETALKNHQASIQNLKTQIDQLSKLISERPQGSLSSTTEPNPREQLNAINIQDDGVIEPEPKSRQETVKKSEGSTESFSSTNRGPVHEDRILQIEELDEWQTYKPRTLDKPKLCQNEPDTSPNQLKVGNKVLLDAADPHIVTTTPNEEIPLTVLSIFPFGTVEVSHPKFGTFKVNNTRLKPYFDVIDSKNEKYIMASSRGKKIVVPASKKKGASSSTGPIVEIRHPLLQFPRRPQEELFQILRAQPLIELFFGIIEPTYLELTMELCSTFHLQTVMTNYDDLGTGEAREHWRRQHPRRLLLMMHVARARHRPCLFHFPCDSAPNGAASERGHLYWPLRTEEPTLPQYRLAQSTEEEAYEDIPDDVPPQHEDPPTQPPPPSHPVHEAAAYADISERLTRFEQQTYGLMNLYDRRSILLHFQTDSFLELQFEEFIIQEVSLLSLS
ncbi:hypothetical protein GOBAR_AA02992 [Gossypium barbadense]|uniref:Uncharacterized protein n=1 Tax=Gossypium barbadense TaxID=3634 RepID=A0A2P5YPR9_GOSBA|nr:hypothetical protein GOBAR_AA02992 [Gossypium barbadense]